MTGAQELELMHLRNVVGLAAFAVEARRALAEIECATEMRPLNPTTDPLVLVTSRGQWMDCPDMAAQVLCDVHERLDALLIGHRGE
jgi:hypothetical protein